MGVCQLALQQQVAGCHCQLIVAIIRMQPGQPGKVREFKSGQEKVRENRKNQGKVRENVFLHAWNLASWFTGKSLILLPPDVRF